MNKSQSLANHMLYQLDRMMLEHLGHFLREKIGDPFCIYCTAYETQELRISEEASLRWQQNTARLSEDKPLPEDLIQPSRDLSIDVNTNKQRALSVLSEKVEDDSLRDLCSLYSALISEQYALERATAAIEWADTYASEQYASKVKEVLNLDRWILPWWWSLNLHNLRKHLKPTDLPI